LAFCPAEGLDAARLHAHGSAPRSRQNHRLEVGDGIKRLSFAGRQTHRQTTATLNDAPVSVNYLDDGKLTISGSLAARRNPGAPTLLGRAAAISFMAK
jgi:hypothetical protein